jgi:hypothetical protein
MTSPIKQFQITQDVVPQLRAHGNGWLLKGRFRINIQFAPCSHVGRFEYRQYIRGNAWIQHGIFANPRRPSVATWSSTGPRQNAGGVFKISGGLSTSWREDSNGISNFGHRKNPPHSSNGLIDRYLPNQQSGDRYELMDTYGMSGTRRRFGTKLYFHLFYRCQVIEFLSSGRKRVVATRIFDTEGGSIIT